MTKGILKLTLTCDTLNSMRYAIFSDVHNHMRALKVVLRHAGQQQIDNYFCLGDIGDIGAEDCVTVVREMGVPSVFGNWEVLTWHHYSPANRQWVLDLPPMRKDGHFWLTHAAPLWPKEVNSLADLKHNRYTVPRSHLFPYLHVKSHALWRTITALSKANISLMFHGHTHYQMGWRLIDDNQLEKMTDRTITLHSPEIIIVGVGSVGRPEDSAKPSYVIYDDEARVVEMVRV
ncbi:metallophosphoesterase family protein [Chloroflexota bacterium]